MKKILPVTYPTITTFPAYAATVSILQSYKNTYDWLFSQYIKIYAIDILNRKKEDTLTPFSSCFFSDYDSRRLSWTVSDFTFLRREVCPYLNAFEVPNDVIKSSGESFVSFLKRAIDLDMYCYFYADVSKISVYQTAEPFSHEMFVYGYDDSKQVFYFADFLNNLKYTHSQCTYDEVEQALQNVENLEIPGICSVAIIQYSEVAGYSLDYNYIVNSIYEYINPSTKQVKAFNDYIMASYIHVNWNTKVYAGIDVYAYLSSFIDHETKLGKDYIDHRLYHAMYEHKEMMIKRLDYLLKNQFLDERKRDIVNEYAIIKDKLYLIRNMVLKYGVNHNVKILERIKELLFETQERERQILSQIFDIHQ